MFSCEFCEISKNTFFSEHLRATASGLYQVFSFSSCFYMIGSSLLIILFVMEVHLGPYQTFMTEFYRRKPFCQTAKNRQLFPQNISLK